MTHTSRIKKPGARSDPRSILVCPAPVKTGSRGPGRFWSVLVGPDPLVGRPVPVSPVQSVRSQRPRSSPGEVVAQPSSGLELGGEPDYMYVSYGLPVNRPYPLLHFKRANCGTQPLGYESVPISYTTVPSAELWWTLGSFARGYASHRIELGGGAAAAGMAAQAREAEGGGSPKGAKTQDYICAEAEMGHQLFRSRERGIHG